MKSQRGWTSLAIGMMEGEPMTPGTFGRLYLSPQPLAEAWWLPLEEAGLAVEQTPMFAASNGCLRAGCVRRGPAAVKVRAFTGGAASASNRRAGEYFLFLQWSIRTEEDERAHDLLVNEVEGHLCRAGAALVESPHRGDEKS